jgi:hypothetical protein
MIRFLIALIESEVLIECQVPIRTINRLITINRTLERRIGLLRMGKNLWRPEQWPSIHGWTNAKIRSTTIDFSAKFKSSVVFSGQFGSCTLQSQDTAPLRSQITTCLTYHSNFFKHILGAFTTKFLKYVPSFLALTLHHVPLPPSIKKGRYKNSKIQLHPYINKIIN